MKIKINPFAVLLLFFAAFFCETIPLACLLLAACTHEICHLCFFSRFGVKTRQVEILPFGIAASFDGVAALSYRQEFLCVIAGPLSNLFFAAVFRLVCAIPLFSGRISGAETLIVCNLALGAVNLLPIYPLDGGRCLFCLLKSRLEYAAAEKTIKAVSGCFLCLLFCAGIVLALGAPYNFSLIFIFAYLVFYLIFNGFD